MAMSVRFYLNKKDGGLLLLGSIADDRINHLPRPGDTIRVPRSDGMVHTVDTVYHDYDGGTIDIEVV